MSILVTDGDQRATLAVVRALGAAGIAVTVGYNKSRSLAGVSKFTAKVLTYPSPASNCSEFIECIAQELRSGDYRVVLPMTDVSMVALVSNAHRLPPEIKIPFPGIEVVRLAQDKKAIIEIAAKLGIGAPATLCPHPEQRLEDFAKSLKYPVVIKPRVSRYLSAGAWQSGLVDFARDSKEFLHKYPRSHESIPFPLVQETIHGEGRGVFLLVWNGELKAAFCHRRLREKPPWGGVSVLRESAPLDKELVSKSFDLLRAIGWQGVAMIEFKVDGRNQSPKIMEINGRFWGSLQLAIDAGLNLPLMVYRLATGENVVPQFEYNVGVRSRWLLGDFDSLLISLRNKNGTGRESSGRLRTCIEFLKFWQPDTHYEVFKLSDRSPGWFECGEYLKENAASFWNRSD